MCRQVPLNDYFDNGASRVDVFSLPIAAVELIAGLETCSFCCIPQSLLL
jgi:hypothetical protein